jgi:hypothetical protein
MDRSQLTQSKNLTSPTVSVRIHRGITRQHPRLHQNLHLLRRGNKNIDIKFSAHERFWNNLHQVAQNQKIGKPNNLIVLGTQDLWVLMLCRSFFTPGRYTRQHPRLHQNLHHKNSTPNTFVYLPGVKKLLHNINIHRSCAPKTIKLFGFPICRF